MLKPPYRSWIASLAYRPSTPAWLAVVSGILGESLSSDETALYTKLAGGVAPSPDGVTRAEIIAGRRAGKSEEAARAGVYEILFGGHEDFLAVGQIGVFVVVCPKLDTANEVMNFARGLCQHKSVKPRVQKMLDGEIVFKTGLSLQVVTADAFSIRGKTLVGAIVDEACFLDSTSKGVSSGEIFDALLPGLQRIKGAPPRRCIVISSAYIKHGAAYEIYRDFYGVADAPWTVFHGTSQDFNPDLDIKDLEAAKKRNEKAFAREYESVFADSIDGTSWFGTTTIAACIDKTSISKKFEPGLRYVAAVDFAFKYDSTAIAIATNRKTDTGARVDVVHVEEIKPKPGVPLSPLAVCLYVAKICGAYGCTRVFMDQHESSSLRELLKQCGIIGVERPWKGTGPESKALKFNAILEAMKDQSVRLPDQPVLISQFGAVTGELLPSGLERIEARRGHDDMVSASVLAIDEAKKLKPRKADADLTPWEQHQRKLNACAIGRNPILPF